MSDVELDVDVADKICGNGGGEDDVSDSVIGDSCCCVVGGCVDLRK